MKTKKLLISLIMVVFGITLVSSSAMAGSKQRHRWEGVAIGVGAAILGNAIYQAHRAEQRPQVVYVEPEPTCRYRLNHGPKHRHGHWEWQEAWVPPTYEKVWNPGHYNRKGHWVPGHWIEVKTEDGHWTQERVWVARNHSPY
ncbi:MAG: hypothetical protein HGJ93_08930 [Desulfosarcina sp.]|nr:hypothetical protein [Desulfosarcina sp.]MBC2766066.1 hypothetical protein [Desulfosarcina sp.]